MTFSTRIALCRHGAALAAALCTLWMRDSDGVLVDVGRADGFGCVYVVELHDPVAAAAAVRRARQDAARGLPALLLSHDSAGEASVVRAWRGLMAPDVPLVLDPERRTDSSCLESR